MRPRAFIGFGIVIAFLAAIALGSAPRLHDQVHRGGPQHECAATLIAAGNCEHAPLPAIAPKSEYLPTVAALLPRQHELLNAPVASSILEHAPPGAS